MSYAYYIKSAFDSKLYKFVLETGTNSGISFVNSLIKNLTKLSDDYLLKVVPMKMTLNDRQKFDNSLNCSICQKIELEIIVILQVALEVQPTLNVTWIIK